MGKNKEILDVLHVLQGEDYDHDTRKRLRLRRLLEQLLNIIEECSEEDIKGDGQVMELTYMHCRKIRDTTKNTNIDKAKGVDMPNA